MRQSRLVQIVSHLSIAPEVARLILGLTEDYRVFIQCFRNIPEQYKLYEM